MPKSLSMDGMPKYQHRPLAGDDIRLIKLQPGNFADDLYAEIVQCRLETASSKPEQSLLSTTEVDKTLPQGWRSFRTPEGRWLYDNWKQPYQYYHLCLSSLSEELRESLQFESDSTGQKSAIERDQHYEALSYVWGDPTPRDVLFVTDALDVKITFCLPITSNLSSALRHLRHEQRIRLLWVDAVCINQHDHPERNTQVLRIAHIFRSAWRVIVWLGEASNDSGPALKTLQYLAEQIEISQDRWIHSPPGSREPQWNNFDVKLPYGDAEWTSLALLFARAWFERLWVMQEIAVANASAIVQCGYDTMLYYYLRRAIVGLHIRSGAPQSVLRQASLNVELSYGPRNLSVWDLTFTARSHRCSVPHDKIYGLLGFFWTKTSK